MRFRLIPFDDKLEPKTLEVEEKHFKKKRKGRFYYFIATQSVRFDAAKVAPPEPDQPDEPAPDEPTPDKPKPDKDEYDL